MGVMIQRSQTLQIENLSAEDKQRFEEQASQLNLSPAAYLKYLMSRTSLPANEAARLDRHVREVFGRHGELVRRLAK